MNRSRGRIVYLDGTEAEFATIPADTARAGRWLTLHGMPLDPEAPAKTPDFGLLVAFNALQRQKDVNGIGYEPWLDTVAEIELTVEEVPPTETEPSDG